MKRGVPMAYHQIARRLRTTTERVRATERRALRNLRVAIREQGLAEDLEGELWAALGREFGAEDA